MLNLDGHVNKPPPKEVEVIEMTEVSTRPPVADDFCEDCGYEPELKRTLGSFQVFAVSFAFISVAVGIFATYDDVLQNAGPAGIPNPSPMHGRTVPPPHPLDVARHP